MSALELTLEPSRGLRRLEVINGAGGRRTWSADAKARILEETLAPGAVVSEIARRHGLTPQQVFTWRREARRAQETMDERVAFVPAVLDTAAAQTASSVVGQRSRAPWGEGASIEVELAGALVRIGPHAGETAITAVIRALRSTT